MSTRTRATRNQSLSSRTRFVTTLFAVLLLLHQGKAAAWDFVWMNQLGTSATDSLGGVAADSLGVYVGGGTLGSFPGQSSAGGADAFLRKVDFLGAEVWTRQFGTPSGDTAGSVATDGTDVYVAGTTGGSLPAQVSAGGFDAYIRKYSSAGGLLWTHQFGTAGRDLVQQIAVHWSGVYLAGRTDGTFPGEPAGSGEDSYVAKLDPGTGGLIWVRQFGVRGLPVGIPSGVAVDDTGVYGLGQHWTGDVSVPPSLLRRYDFDGNVLWTRQIPTSNGCVANFWSVAVHPTGVYALGQADDGYFAGQGCQGTLNSAVHARTGVGFLRKFAVNGDVSWTREIKAVPKQGHGVDLFTGAKRIRVSDAGVFVSANLSTSFAGHVPGQSPQDTAGCPASDPDFFDKFDAYVRQYDFDGNVVWTHQFGSGRFDIAWDVAASGDSLYIGGDTDCRIDPSQTPRGGRDAYLLRVTLHPTSLPGQVQLIVGRVETLNDAGLLAPGEFGSLVKHLEGALSALDQGKSGVAGQRLEVFINEVETLESRGTLSAASAAPLVAAADAVIAQF